MGRKIGTDIEVIASFEKKKKLSYIFLFFYILPLLKKSLDLLGKTKGINNDSYKSFNLALYRNYN